MGYRIGYTVVRVLFGLWFLGSGIEYFLPYNLQPQGGTPVAHEFLMALIHSGLFAWVKAIEIVVGLLVLANRGVLPAALAVVPITVVVAYWNCVLDPSLFAMSFGIATVVLNAILLLPFADRIAPLLLWRHRLGADGRAA